MSWSRLVGALAGLAITVVSVVILYALTITPILNYDYDGFNMLQTKSGIYAHGFTLEEALGVGLGSKMFNDAHIVMLPAVDAQTQFSTTYTGAGRVVRVYDNGTPTNPNMMPLRIGGDYTLAGSSTFSWLGITHFPSQSEVDATPWIHAYRISSETIYNKSLTFKSWLGIAEPSYNSTYFTVHLIELRGLSESSGGFNLMVNGAPRSSDLLFYTGNKPERYLWLIGQTP